MADFRGGMGVEPGSLNAAMRRIPAVNSILISEQGRTLVDKYGHELVAEALNSVLEGWRGRIIAGDTRTPSPSEIAGEAAARLEEYLAPRLKRVINATGIILHTNLGRAVLSEKAKAAIEGAASYYTNLEYDLSLGKRGSRHSLVEDLLVSLTGAESAMVVNNNAAAVLLAIHTLAAGKEAVVSRGELVEIGGSFRIPEVLKLGGVQLIEVGTTNRTHLSDYQEAIGPNTALILKVHTSNFRIVGFTKGVDRRNLKELAANHNLPMVEDLGSGSLLDLSEWGLEGESPVSAVLAQGVDVVTFSGDKLLGGPQAGIIAGKKALLDKMKANQLTRALRPDKFTLAALEATLREYLQPAEAFRKLPAYRMLSRSLKELEDTAERLAAVIGEQSGIADCKVIGTVGAMGGGSLPGQGLPSRGVALSFKEISLQQADAAMRNLPVPIIGYIEEDRIVLDVRTLLPGDEETIITGLKQLLEGVKK